MKTLLIIFAGLFLPAIALGQTAVVKQNSQWIDLAWYAAQILAPIVISLIGALIAYLTKFLMQKIKNEKINAILDKADDAFMKVALFVTDAYVKQMKKANEDGKLTDEEKKEAMNIAIKSFVNFLGQKGANDFVKSLGFNSINDEGAQKAIIARIESANVQNKAMGFTDILLKNSEDK